MSHCAYVHVEIRDNTSTSIAHSQDNGKQELLRQVNELQTENRELKQALSLAEQRMQTLQEDYHNLHHGM